jgi:hypothetical protein
MAGALEHLDMAEYAAEFEDAIDAESLADMTADLLGQLRGIQDSPAVHLREELLLLQQLARDGSGIKPTDED